MIKYYVVGKDESYWSVREEGNYTHDITKAIPFYDLETAEDWAKHKDLIIYEVGTTVRRLDS